MKKQQETNWVKRIWKWFGYTLLLGFIFLLTIKFGIWGALPNTTELENPKTKLASEIYSADGKVLGKMFYQEDRTNSEYDDIPIHLKNALIATEDARFYDHSGIDGRALLRAVAMLGRDGGGSTITQQLAKNMFHREEVTKSNRLIQKIKEWLLAAYVF
jgi:penicillin-binding protein 1A